MRLTANPLARRALHPDDLGAPMLAPLYARVSSLMLGHVAGLCLCLEAMIRLKGPWPAVFMAAHAVLLVLRLMILARAGALGRVPTAACMVRWRVPYQTVGVVWSATGGISCAALGFGYADEFTRVVAVILAVGVAAGISSRNAGTPRFASAQIVVWLLPYAATAPVLGPWYWGWTVLILFYIAALGSIVRQQYADTLLLFDAQRTSRQSYAEIDRQAAELRALFNNTAAGVAELDPIAGRVLRTNPALCRMVARSEAELLALSWPVDLMHPDEHADHAAFWAGIVATGQSAHCERRLIRPSGEVVAVRINSSISGYDSDGKPIRLVAVLQDITERKLAEAKLRDSEEMLNLSLEAGRIGTYRHDLVHRSFTCSYFAKQMFGFVAAGDGPMDDLPWINSVLPEDGPRMRRETTTAYAEHKPTANFEYRIRHPTDGIRFIETRCRMEYDAAGQAVATTGVTIDITERREAEARIAHLAHHDPLTGLPNRTLFHLRLDEALGRAARGERIAIYCLDLDHFKDVNDTLGHPVGDALLVEVTARLHGLLRQTDTVARLGGDEFAVIQSLVTHVDDVTRLAARIISALSAPYTIEGHRVVIGCSGGIAMAPDDGLEASSLLRHADTALYAAKDAGRGRYQFFEPEMDARMQARRSVELDLRAALETNGFEVFYQPVMDVATRSLSGFEALLRWRHPTRGMVAPDRFIPIAEATGLIVPIGAWVLRAACAEAARWPGAWRVAVNLSPVQIGSAALLDVVAGALSQSGLPASRLELEITESAMMQDTETTLDTLHRLKALGVSIAMDDFGTGYSSLSYLQRFPFDKVKIDRAFITDLGQSRASAAIMGAAVALGRGLDMRTTAEGVETETQLAALARLGCQEAQGYLFSPARPAVEIPALIDRLAARVSEAAD